jgi:hypothetical protein
MCLIGLLIQTWVLHPSPSPPLNYMIVKNKNSVTILNNMEIDFSKDILAAKKGKAPLNKPFRLPSGSKKKFGVYVKNDKGNIVMVKFGDPNMSIKRDNPERRKAYRSRHGCDNPGPKYKANYWSCKMWSAKPVSKITGSEEEVTLEAEVQAKGKGLWYNIQQKKKRMGKNYRPAPKGSKDRPTQEALKKAQANDYLNEEYEWDGETEFDQIVFLEDKSLAQVEEVEDEFEDYKEDFYGMIVGSINSIYQHSKNVVEKLNDPMVKENLTEPFLQQMAILAEDYMITIHNYVMFNKENKESEDMEENEASTMFKVGDKVKNVNAKCKHYGSEGIVKEIRDLPDDMGYAVVYECTNEGSNWKKGDMLGKTEVQLQKIEAEWSMKYKRSIDCNNPKGFSQEQHCKSKASEDEKYEMENDEEYKGMMTTEGQKFNDFLKQCIPTKQGDDKSKFKSCLQEYKKNK